MTGVILRRPDDGVCDASIWEGDLHLWAAAGNWRKIARRGIVATILARYLGVDPRSVEFGRGSNGKPELITQSPAGEVRFSVSTSEGMLALAVGAAPIGIDVEPRARVVSLDGMLEFVCTERERDQLSEPMPVAARSEAFIWCWTGKEACAKACGLGLAVPFSEIDVGTGPVGGVCAVAPVAGSDLGPWVLHRVDALAGYAVAIAVL